MVGATYFVGGPVSSNNNTNTSVDREKIRKELELSEDGIVKNNISTKAKIGLDKSQKLPIYAVRGMKGDRNSTFYEFLELGKIPFLIGGASFVGVFSAGINKANAHKASMAGKAAKHAAMGVILYAVGKSLANAIIDLPIKAFTGIDVSMPYRKVVKLQEVSPNQKEKSRVEYHKAYESVDFPRWDLLDKYNLNTKNGDVRYYDKIAKKLGYDEDLNESGQAVKPTIKETVIRSRTWKSLLLLPFAALGVGLSVQEPWDSLNVKTSLKNSVKGIKGKLIHPLRAFKATKLAESFKSMWHGNGKVSGIAGKTVILASAIAPVVASVTTIVAAKSHKTLPPANGEVHKNTNYSES